MCADALKHVLETQCSCRVTDLTRIDEDPPDFRLQIDGSEFFAEVTSIIADGSLHAHFRELADAIQTAGTERGVLSGTYELIFRRKPKVPKPLSASGKSLLHAALSYVAQTAHVDNAQEFEIWRDATGFIQIAKGSSEECQVGVLWVGEAKREIEVVGDLTDLIQRAVDDKLRKLARRNVPTKRTFLVLYDAYGYAEPRHAARALQNVQGHSRFHSVFWIASYRDRANLTYPDSPGRSGVFIYSSRNSWQSF